MHSSLSLKVLNVFIAFVPMPSSSATTRRDSRPFPCSNPVSIEAKKSRLVLKSRLVFAAEDGKSYEVPWIHVIYAICSWCIKMDQFALSFYQYRTLYIDQD